MKTLRLLPLFLILLLSCASREKLNNPFYWKITKANKIIHVLGTMHIGFELKDLPPQIISDLESSELVAVEADEKTIKEAIVEFQKFYRDFYGRQSEHFPQLASTLKKKTWHHLRFTLEHEDVKRYLRQKGILHPSTEIHYSQILILIHHFSELKQFHVFHPELLKEHTRRNELKIQNETDRIMYKQIVTHAQKKAIPTRGLDDVGQLVRALHPKIKDYGLDQVESIFSGDNNLKKQHHFIQEMQEIYRSGDEKRLLELTNKEDFDRETLLNNRNKNWFDQLNGLDENKIFLAVGVLHLVGDENLFIFFKDRNYEVEKINLNLKSGQ